MARVAGSVGRKQRRDLVLTLTTPQRRPATACQPPPRPAFFAFDQPHRRTSRRARTPRGPARPRRNQADGTLEAARGARLSLQPVLRRAILLHVLEGMRSSTLSRSATTDGIRSCRAPTSTPRPSPSPAFSAPIFRPYVVCHSFKIFHLRMALRRRRRPPLGSTTSRRNSTS